MSIKILGAVIVVVAVGFAIVFHFSGKKGRFAAGFLTSSMFFVGFGMMMLDRITEVTVRGVGTIKAASAQASADASVIQALKTQVENQTATVDAVTAQAKNAASLSERAASQVSITDQKLADLNATLTAAKVTLENLQKDADFAKTIEEAQNDNRVAFDKLSSIANDQNSPYAQRAAGAWNAIMDAHSEGMYESNFHIPWQAGVDPATLSLAALRSIFASAPVPLKPALLEYINDRNDVPKLEKLDFFIEVMKTDASLKAAEYAGRYFTKDANLQIKPLALDYLTKWWSEHREGYENPAPERK
ncbi:hypothetical protein [Rhizobium leucaenae]|uniref:Uncharacterized protein n=1 Tax=Rhizobium leucaenae TaxID=29450 RepID=A0A7W7EJW1_9HYPH|nr:hypothetical protein [Rhizobium leucaenae]MBB4568261.1 hypothetical protein [Rhizobium leucaenae]MBB6304350.1 hypothetical protein [Rhizobium leucaenae]